MSNVTSCSVDPGHGTAQAEPSQPVTMTMMTRQRTRQRTRRQAAAQGRDLNELIRYTMWAVFTVTDRDFAREEAATELTDVLDQANGKGIVTRGCYDLQGMRADADFMLWWVAPTSDELQEMYVNFRRTKLGYASEPVWSAMALHRPGRVQQEPHPGVPGRGGAEELRLRLPVRPLPRVVPARRRPSAARCSPSTARWPASTRTCGPTR